jgi:hypothetical protein
MSKKIGGIKDSSAYDRPTHPWKRPMHPNSLANLSPRPENLTVPGEVEVTKLQIALIQSGISKSELARRMNWMRTRPDVHRVNQYLGLETLSNGEKRKRVSYETAVKLCKAMNSSPFDLGI